MTQAAALSAKIFFGVFLTCLIIHFLSLCATNFFKKTNLSGLANLSPNFFPFIRLMIVESAQKRFTLIIRLDQSQITEVHAKSTN